MTINIEYKTVHQVTSHTDQNHHHPTGPLFLSHWEIESRRYNWNILSYHTLNDLSESSQRSWICWSEDYFNDGTIQTGHCQKKSRLSPINLSELPVIKWFFVFNLFQKKNSSPKIKWLSPQCCRLVAFRIYFQFIWKLLLLRGLSNCNL